MRKLLAVLLLAAPAFAQVGPPAGAKPGTCPAGQFMNKTSATALPTCATPAGAGDITAVNITTNSPVTGGASCAAGACSFTLGLTGLTALTTKGDLLGFAGAATRIPVGADGTVLTADSSNANGVSYQTAGAPVSCFSSGVGSPEGVVTAVTGCTYVNTSNSDIYTKAYGSGNTGWVLTTAPGFLYGAGSPEASVTGYIGDLYLNTTDLHWWQKQTGDGTNTGWVDLGATPPSGGGRKITGVGTPNRLAYWTGSSVLGFTSATWDSALSKLTATTFAGDLNGTINTATTAATQAANDNSTKVATTAYVDSIGSALLISTPPQGRLTGTSGSAVPPTDQTALATVYYTMYVGNVLSLYYGSAWRPYTITEKSLKLTDTQTCTTTSGSTSVTGCTDTSQLVRGMVVSSTNVTGGQTISAITSSTAFTLSANADGTGSASTTFKVPASTMVDIVAEPTSATAFRLRFLTLYSNSGAGTSARAVALTTQDSVLMNGLYAAGDSNTIAAGAARYLATIRTTTTAGQTEDSFNNRLLVNYYQGVDRPMWITPGYNNNNAATSYTSNSTTWTAANSGTGATGGYIALGWGVDFTVFTACQNSNAGNYCYVGIGNDATTGASAEASVASSNAAESGSTAARFTNTPLFGYHTVNLVIRVNAQTGTWYADDARAGSAADVYATAIFGTIRG